jgi:signal transduction histidine kinase
MGTGQGMGHGMGFGMGYGAYLNFIQDIAGADVWIVDEDMTLITYGGYGMMHGMTPPQYSDLPENADHVVKEVFTGKTVLSGDFSGLLSEASLTVGAPVKDETGQVFGVVLLHSPINGIDHAVADGMQILAISLGIALAVAFLLSIWLSRSFTNPIVQKEARDAIRLEKIRREFVANISHELKTPITVIRGSLEAILDEIVTDPVQVREYHSQMLREASFLQRLVGDLLDLSKLQNAEFVMEKQELAVSDLLDDVVRSIKPVAEKKGVAVRLESDGTSPFLFGDYGRIRQMLMIILDNAVKFSPEDGEVGVSLKDKAITVGDSGPGIEEAELPMIFERFYKSRSEQNKTGTGLGLAIAKQIAGRHDIELLARNRESGGAVFVMNFRKNKNKGT